MGFLDWFRPKPPPRFSTAIARDLAEAVFALHPAAEDRVVLRIRGGVVTAMEVSSLDPVRDHEAKVDPARQTARISELATELAKSAASTSGEELTVMRDRVIWMPSVVPVNPPIP